MTRFCSREEATATLPPREDCSSSMWIVMRYWLRRSILALLLLAVPPVVGNGALRAGYLPITSLKRSADRPFASPLLSGGMEPVRDETEWTVSATWVESRSQETIPPQSGLYTYRPKRPLDLAWGFQGQGAGSGSPTTGPVGDSSASKAGSFCHINLPPPSAVDALPADREAMLPSSLKSRLFRPPRRGCEPPFVSVG